MFQHGSFGFFSVFLAFFSRNRGNSRWSLWLEEKKKPSLEDNPFPEAWSPAELNPERSKELNIFSQQTSAESQSYPEAS